MSEERRIIYKLTRSQQMALVSVLVEHWSRCGEITEEYLDCSHEPPVVTTVGDLLQLFSGFPEWEAAPIPPEQDVADAG